MHQSELVVPPYRIITAPDDLPSIYSSYREHAVLVEEFDLELSGQTACFFGVGLGDSHWPELVVAQRYEPAGWGFYPGILIVPQTDVAFIGAGVRLLAYRLAPPIRRLWIDRTNTGFWSWRYHSGIVVMSAELELAAWSAEGTKLWTEFVEPPWSYSVHDDVLTLDVIGNKTTFPLAAGPRAG